MTVVDNQKSYGKSIELRVSIFQIYQDIITDLMVFGSRGLTVIEKEERTIIENLSEHNINSIADLRSHVHHAFQIRKTIIKPDPKLKLKSHLMIVFTIYDSYRMLSQIGFIELAGSENASNDQQIIKSNSLSSDEKKYIAKSFNALSAVISNEPLWKESSLTMCCKDLLGNNSNKIFLCTLLCDQGVYKHTLASLKYTNRIREGYNKITQRCQQELKERLQLLRKELRQTGFMGTEWIINKEEELNNLENQAKANINLLGSPQESEEFLMEIEILRKQLHMLKKAPTPPLHKESLRRRSASPMNEDVSTDRENYIRQKLLTVQSQNESQLKKIEDLNLQIFQREQDIKIFHGKIGDLERILYEKDRIIQEQDFKINENALKITEMNGKISEYSKKFKILKDQSSKTLTQAQFSNNHEEVLEMQVLELEKKLYKEREEFSAQLAKLKANIQAKDRIIQDLQSSGTNCVHEKDSVIQELKQKLKTKSTSLSDLEKQLLNLNNNYNESRFKLEVESSSSKKYEEECLMLRRKFEELNSRYSSIESKNLLLLQKNETLDKELSACKQEIESRKYKSHQLSASLKEMENTLGISSEESQRIRYEINQLKSENQMLRVDKENFYNENYDLRQENNLIKDELKKMTGQLESTNQFLDEKEKSLGETGTQFMKKKKKKIKTLKENVALLQQQLKDCQAIAEEEIKRAIDERDQAIQEVEECKGSQIHDLSVVENQVGLIEEQLIKLKEQNKQLMAREAELVRELRNGENGKEKYKSQVIELKEEIQVLQTQLAEMDEFTKEYIENHRKEISEMKIGDEKAVALKSRIRAMHDVKNMIKAHRIQR